MRSIPLRALVLACGLAATALALPARADDGKLFPAEAAIQSNPL